MKPTQEQVIAWARESGFEFNSLGATYTSGWLSDLLNSFATLAYEAGRKEENEACAKVCEAGTGEPIQMKTLDILRKERERIAATIRARMETNNAEWNEYRGREQ